MQAIESKAQPSPPEPTMRQERTVQATIFEVFARHEIGCELKAISQWLDRQHALVSLVAGDLRRRGVRETGRRGFAAGYQQPNAANPLLSRIPRMWTSGNRGSGGASYR